jgi:hypothetical protein
MCIPSGIDVVVFSYSSAFLTYVAQFRIHFFVKQNSHSPETGDQVDRLFFMCSVCPGRLQYQSVISQIIATKFNVLFIGSSICFRHQ